MSRFAAGYVHLNGRLVRGAVARISVFDRGLLYGDGLLETLRTYRGQPFALREHLARLRQSAKFAGIALPRQAWEADIAALLARNQLTTSDAWLRITVTRGVAAPGLLPPARIRPTVILTAGRLSPAVARVSQHGAAATLLPFARGGVFSEHKTLNYLPAVMGKALAARRRALEGLFVTRDGMVTEGTVSNVFVWRRHRLLTPPASEAGPRTTGPPGRSPLGRFGVPSRELDSRATGTYSQAPGGILPGITRRLVIDAAAAAGFRVSEQRLSTRTLLTADEVFLTSSLIEVVPVLTVDGQRIGTGHIGPVTRRVQQLYRQIVDRSRIRRSRI